MILSLNTTTAPFGAALMGMDGNLIGEFCLSPGPGRFSRFMPGIDFLFRASNTDIRGVRALAAATGPGSFTGLRAGLSVAKGFCRALGVPAMGVSSLEALASQATAQDFPICVLIDSRRDEVFAGLFQRGPQQELIRLKEDGCFPIDDLPSFVEGRALFLGNDYNRQVQKLQEALGPRALLAPRDLWRLRASSIGSIGVVRFHDRDFDEPRTLVPVYLRPPDIKPNPFPVLLENRNPDLKKS